MKPNVIEVPTHPRLGHAGNFVPELAGVCTYAEAAREGLGVEENVALLKRYNWVEQRINDLILANLNSTPEWEVKDALALHAWLGAEHAKSLQERVADLRHPPHNFHVAPCEKLEAFCQEALRSCGTIEVLVRSIVSSNRRCWNRTLSTARTNALADQPTRRLLRFVILEEEEAIAWGEAALEALIDSPEKEIAAQNWRDHLSSTCRRLAASRASCKYSRQRFRRRGPSTALRRNRLDAAPRCAPRKLQLQLSAALGLRAARAARKRASARSCLQAIAGDGRARDDGLDCVEAARGGFGAGQPKPWEYTREMCRQMWDEARHSMMGEAWLSARGIDWTQIPLNVGFSLGLNSLATPQEAHAALYWIEQGLMPSNTGKAYEWRTARDAGDRLAMLFMDYDWADEVLHVHIGHWIIEEMGSRKAAEAAGEEAFGRVMATRRERQHIEEQAHPQREWWPAFVRDALGIEAAPLQDSLADEQDAPWKAAATNG